MKTKMSKKVKIILSVVLAVTLIGTSTGIGYAANKGILKSGKAQTKETEKADSKEVSGNDVKSDEVSKSTDKNATGKNSKADTDTLMKVTGSAIAENNTDDGKLFKDETVYVMTDETGKVSSVTVSDWMKNAGVDGKLLDESSLKDIKNVKGDENFTQNGNKITWDAADKDIYYQGTGSTQVPVTTKITYKLDGKEIKPADLVGKSGKLEIKVDYTNNVKKTVDINGEATQMYVPFAAITGMIMDGEVYSNVVIDNGKIISDGNRQIVVGMAFPGLADDMNLDELKADLKDAKVDAKNSKDTKATNTENADDEFNLDIPESVTITANVTNYETSTILTVVSSDVVSQLNLKDIDSLDDLEGSLDKLGDATNQLVDATSTLSDGASKLAEGSKTLKDNMGTLNSSVGEYTGKITDVYNATTTLSDGLCSVNAGVNSIKGGADSALAGANQIVAGFHGDGTPTNPGATAGAASVAAGTAQLYNTIYSLDSGISGNLEALANGINQCEQGIAAAEAAGANDQKSALETQKASLQIQYATLQNIYSQIHPSEEGSLVAGAETVATGAAAVSSGINQLDAGAVQLQGGLSTMSSGATTLQEGTAKAYNGSVDLQKGAYQLSEAGKKLTDATGKLTDGSNTLSENMDTLANGAATLKSGMSEYKSTGTDKLTDAVKNSFTKVKDRINAMIDLSEDYTNYSGKLDSMNGSVKFIYEATESKN